MEPEEIYDVLMTQLISAANGYDPYYKDKLRKVAKVIQHVAVNRHLEFDCTRHLRMLVRAGFLGTVAQKTEDGESPVTNYSRLAAWPPPAGYFEGPPIGAAYYLQKWFRYNLQMWIESRMRELESNVGVYFLEGWGRITRKI